MLDNKGFTSFQLKIIGIILMFIDHTAQFFTHLPLFFHWLGRSSAPIFLFLASEGYIHTKSKKKYLLRLLSAFWLMNILVVTITYLSNNSIEAISNNIFGTLFLGVLYMYFIYILKDEKEKNSIVKKLFVLLLIVMPIYLNLLLITLQKNNPLLIYKIIKLTIPLPISTEGGIFIVFLAVCFYIFKENKIGQILALLAISILFFLGSPQKPFNENYQ